MMKFDINRLIEEDENNKDSGLPFRFGKALNVDLSLQNSGQWEEVDKGDLWSLQVSSEQAYSINLIFDDFWLSQGSELYIFNEDETMLIGPITSKQNSIQRKFSTDLLQGSSVYLQLFEPKQVKQKSKIHIQKVVHGYKNTFKTDGWGAGFGASGMCMINIECSEGDEWQNEANAVARVLLGNGTSFGTGTLINNTSQNFIPYFLTAFHNLDLDNDKVLSPQEINDAANMVFRFQYRSPSCSGGDGTNYVSYNGALLRSAWADTDFSLLELSQAPQGCVQWAGWFRGTSAARSAVGIHHPRADVMKISVENDWVVAEPYPSETDVNYWRVFWNKGSTEVGSSGSALFDQNHRIIGQLRGGAALCSNPSGKDFYGRFDLSWDGDGTPSTRLRDWLDPQNKGLLSIGTKSFIRISSTPSAVCHAGLTAPYVFTLSGVPAGSAITWTVGPDINIISGQGTNDLTVEANSAGVSGFRDISVTVNASCGIREITREVWIGKPAVPDTTLSGPTQVDASTTVLYQGSKADGATSYEWRLPYPFQIVPWLGGPANDWQMENTTTYNQLLAYTGIDGNSGYVQLMGVNDCGNGGARILWVDHSGDFGGPGDPFARSLSTDDGITIFPNPAKTETTVAIVSHSELDKKEMNNWPTLINGISILDSQMTEVLKIRSKEPQAEIKLNLSRLKVGVYHVLIETDKGRVTKTLSIE